MPMFACATKKNPALLVLATPLLALPALSSSAQVIYQDDFNRPDSLNALGATSVGGINWSLQRDATDPSFDTISGTPSPDVEIINNVLRLNCGSTAATALNNNDVATWYVDSSLDAVQQYSTSFKYVHLNIHPYSTSNQVGSQRNGGFF